MSQQPLFMGLRVGYAHCPHCMKLQRWFYEHDESPALCFGCGKMTRWAECVQPERSDEWIPLVLGSEISVVQKKELHGRISHGWFCEGKVLIAYAKDYAGAVSPVFEQLVKLAHEEAARRNAEALPLTNCSALEIWVNNPNSCLGWVRHSGPFTSRAKTEKRVRDIKLFDAVKGCRFQIRSLPDVKPTDRHEKE